MDKRQLALSIFSEWRTDKRFIDNLFETRLFRSEIETADKNWIQFIVSGTIERFFSLDYVLKKVTSNKFNKNKQIIRNILYLASYELLFSGNQHYAVINESVNLAKKNKKKFEASIINGVLREVSKQKDALLEEINKSTDVEIKYNIPKSLHQLLIKEYSEADLIGWYSLLYQNPKRFWARRNRLAVSIDDPFIRVNSFSEIKAELLAGQITIQDKAAGMVCEYLSPKEKSRILDFCSAPGGKATYLAELTNDNAEIVATDSDAFRLSKVEENIKRLQLNSVHTKSVEELVPNSYDQVLVDIPCSGIGVLGKRRDMAYFFNPETLDELETLQKEILEQAKQFVKPGGELIISTCTIFSRENMDLVHHFLKSSPKFTQSEEPLVCLPFSGETDGAFAIKLKRYGAEE